MKREQLLLLVEDIVWRDAQEEIMAAVDQYAAQQVIEARIEELSAAINSQVNGTATSAMIAVHQMKDRLAELQAILTNKGEQR